jgi:glycosyltransferase involved in cell wall biosynthesis
MTVLFLGPLPPPVHGFSAINQAMLERLREHTAVEVFDRSVQSAAASRLPRSVAGLCHCLALLMRFRRALRQRPSGLYAGLSGGLGQALDLPFLLMARLHGVPITLHHHSYAYLNKPSRLAAAVFWSAAGARHICLCDDMSRTLQAAYGIAGQQTVVISNAAFMPALLEAPDVQTKERQGSSANVVFGFLSNITPEKGIFDFFEAADAIRKLLPSAHGVIAGPVAPEIVEDFKQALKERPWLRHIGPVYDDAKVAFYSSIDVLLFPTRYRNEAEPVSILEALRAGVVVVAAKRGCIPGMLNSAESCRCCDIGDFATNAAEETIALSRLTHSARSQARLNLAHAFELSHHKYNETLNNLVRAICKPPAHTLK